MGCCAGKDAGDDNAAPLLLSHENTEFGQSSNQAQTNEERRESEGQSSNQAQTNEERRESEGSERQSAERGSLTSSRWKKQPTVEYRQYDGEGTHFNLGLSLEQIEAALDLVLPWDSYTRDESRFLDGDGECWNSGEINGYDLGEVVRDFLRANGFERLSIAEVLWSEGREGVAEATVFFSHIQKLPVNTALQTLREASKVYRKQMGISPKFFIDYLCIRQAQKGDFDLQVVREPIHTTPLLLVELDDAQGGIGNAAPDYFNRSFCIFEVFAAVESSKQDGEQKVLVFGPAVKNPKTAPWLATKVSTYGYNIVNSRKGQCRWPAEKEKIDAFIELNVGYEELDKLVGTAVANACIYGLRTAAAADPSQINVAAQIGVQAANLTDVQLQHFCAHHSNHDEVHSIDLHNCGQIVSVECLRVFSELRQLQIEGCDQIKTASFVVLQTACANLKLNVGKFLIGHGRFKEALAYEQEELKTALQAGDKKGVAYAYGNIGNALQSLGKFEESIENSKKLLEITQQIGNKRGEGAAYGNIAAALISLSRYQEAIEYEQKHLEITQQTGDKNGEGSAYGNIGKALKNISRYDEAIEYQKKHLEIAQQTGRNCLTNHSASVQKSNFSPLCVAGDKSGEGRAYGNIGNALEKLSRYDEAIEYHKKHLEIAQQTGDKSGEGTAYGNIGNALISLSPNDEAIEYHKKHLEIAQQTGDKSGEGRAYCNIGSALGGLGRYDEALEYQKKDLEIAQQTGRN
jgi:tetratricopeptide (TPR) repeat protein